MYKQVQVTRQMLTCKLCKQPQRNVQDLKRHLAKNHFKTDLSSDNDIVKLPGGTFTCFLCSEVEPTTNLATVVAHIATIHNTVEDLYIRKLKGESLGVSGENYVCELCEWFTSREGQFLNHITMQQCMKMLTNRNIIREHGSGRELYRCAVCNNVFNTLQDYLDHVGKDLHCNQSLGFYFWQVDVHKQGIHNPPLLSTVPGLQDRRPGLLQGDSYSAVLAMQHSMRGAYTRSGRTHSCSSSPHNSTSPTVARHMMCHSCCPGPR